jgi:predicted deacylase
VLNGGAGPTVLLTGGKHGDEDEGPITLGRLIRELDPAALQGRLIILPALNTPAALAGQRLSPIGGKNSNRVFPGTPEGSATEQIAYYVNAVLFPLANAFMDLHSGGSSLQILASAIVEPAADPAQITRIVAAVCAFDAPLTVMVDNLGDPRTSTAAAVRAGLTVVGTELTGGGGVSRDRLRICERGVRNVLAHPGVLEASGAAPPSANRRVTRILAPPTSSRRAPACSSPSATSASRSKPDSPPASSTFSMRRPSRPSRPSSEPPARSTPSAPSVASSGAAASVSSSPTTTRRADACHRLRPPSGAHRRRP